jgi:hypothetical protein
MTDQHRNQADDQGLVLVSMGELLSEFNPREFNPDHPAVIRQDGIMLLELEDGRCYKLEDDPAAALRLINHLAQKSWTDRRFFEIATLRICIAMGWWYPEDRQQGGKASPPPGHLTKRYHKSTPPKDGVQFDHDFFSLAQSEIIERGWTQKMIDDFLGEPDAWGFNRHKVSRNLRLYDYERVLNVEDTIEWERSFADSIKRRRKRSGRTLRDMMTDWTIAAERQAEQFEERTEALDEYP